MDTNFTTFINNFEKTLKSAFHETADIDQFSMNRGLPPFVLSNIMQSDRLSVGIPTEYGGRGVIMKECLGVLTTASYESLPLSLLLGINIGLFLEPVAKYANDLVKEDIFGRFLHQKQMGGLMITEPGHGSDALNMQTSHTKNKEGFHIQGTKHWQGLTGMADFWIITSREKNKKGELDRDIDFFICDVTQEGQKIVVEEYFDNLGLYMIPYGTNKLNIQIPKTHQLKPETTGLKMLLDILHRSRMQFPGMGMGFIKRMLDEALNHCKTRMVGGRSLLSMDQVQHQVSKIQSAFTISSAMCFRSSSHSGIEFNLAMEGIEANSMKTVVTDLMLESAQTLVQLSGAKGYRLSHIGGRGTVDSRPFQIFEGSNEMLYTKIAEMVIKMMNQAKQSNLLLFLKNFNLTEKAAEIYKKEINFSIKGSLPQRKLVDLGKVLGRIVSAEFVIEMGASGFRKDLIDNSLESLRQEIHRFLSSYHSKSTVTSIEDYEQNSSWLDLI